MSSTTLTSSTPSATSTSGDDLNCGDGGGSDQLLSLRIASIFVVMVASMFGALFPVIAKRTKMNNVIPHGVFDFAKYFGSGVIIATAFIHLLSPAVQELSSPCLSANWLIYPWPFALCMLSIFSIFFTELFAFRWGTSKLAALGIQHDPHGHGQEISHSHAAHGPEAPPHVKDVDGASSNLEKGVHTGGRVLDDSPVVQILGIAILEFGVILHSFLIGMTLAVDPSFKVLFVVIVFHQMFEGLGLGSRLAFMKLPLRFNWVAICGAVMYGSTTPLGIAVGLGIRSTYNPGSTTANIVSGVMDSLSAGILIYTGLVELLAHEFLFNKEMSQASNKKLAFATVSMLFGAGIMALLGRWA